MTSTVPPADMEALPTPDRLQAVESSDDAFAWYQDWQIKRGRPLRVLHIGNIANNAFINARIQRRYGIDAYVMAYEYYHIMGSPEWEESAFDGDVGDPFFPNWRRVDLGGYQRPPWFASGPLKLCCEMIQADVLGNLDEAERLRIKLTRIREADCAQTYWSFFVRQMRRVRRRSVRLVGESGQAASMAFSKAFRQRIKPELDHARLVEVWKNARNTPRSPPTVRDFSGYRARLRGLKELFQHFDVVQAYSVDGAWPLLVDQPYIAYEHGTLRSIPFEDSALGRLAATVYLAADHAFITNLDCVEAAERLGVPASRFSPLPHAFDDKRSAEFRNNRCDVRPPKDQVVFFQPARQDWRIMDPSYAKGNDRLIRAFAKISQVYSSAVLVMVAWGRDLEATRDLIKQLGIENKVRWVDPMRKTDLWKRYLSCHAVVDQFVVPAFGSVTFEALALGCRVITNVDVMAAEHFFSKAPPICRASSEEEIYERLEQVILDPDDDAKVGEAGAQWIRDYHSAHRTVELQLQAYRRFPGVETSKQKSASESADR